MGSFPSFTLRCLGTSLLVLMLAGLASQGGRVTVGSSADALPAGAQVFQRGTLDLVIGSPTSLAFGPDGRLYVASQTEIEALSLNPVTGQVLAVEQVASDLEGVLGLAFDSTAPASPVTVYASRQDPNATPGFQGTVSTFTGPGWQRQDVITGLPTSAPFSNHMTNGLAFDGQGRLFIAQGSSTDAGITDPPGSQSYWPETPLSAAIVVADVHTPGFDGNVTHSPAGPPDAEDVDLVSGDVAVYAFGVRNPYDFVLHSNGLIYATDNGAMGEAVSASCTTSGGPSSVADELNLIEQGRYYGHPNRNRGRSDPRQCIYHPPEEGSGPGFTGPIAVLPDHCSCDGIVEYTAGAFAGVMPGDLIYGGLTGGNVWHARLSADGRAVVATSVLASNFDQPLDVTVGPDGTIYIAEFGGDRISYLAPEPQPSATPTSTGTAGSATPVLTPTATATPASAGPGDVDCNGDVNSRDATLLLQRSAELIGAVPCETKADTNADGEINAIDAALVLQYDAGLITILPPPR